MSETKHEHKVGDKLLFNHGNGCFQPCVIKECRSEANLGGYTVELMPVSPFCIQSGPKHAYHHDLFTHDDVNRIVHVDTKQERAQSAR